MSDTLRIVAIALLLLAGLVNMFVSILTFAVKSQKYGIADTWQHPDIFAISTLAIGITPIAASIWLYRHRT